jgi:hypothetical protein
VYKELRHMQDHAQQVSRFMMILLLLDMVLKDLIAIQ